MDIQWKPVTCENREMALELHVAPHQANTVETVAQCLEEADRLPLWRPVILLADQQASGFAMYGLWENEGERGRVWLDRFLIHQSAQGKGLALAAFPLLLERLEEEYPSYDQLYLSVFKDNLPAIRLYKRFGFFFNGERDTGGELVMVRVGKPFTERFLRK